MKIIEAKQITLVADNSQVIEVTAEINGKEKKFSFPPDKDAKSIKQELQRVEDAEKQDEILAKESAKTEEQNKKVEKTLKELNK